MVHPAGPCRRETDSCLTRLPELCYSEHEVKHMETKDIIFQLRTQAGLSQRELAEQIFVTRQAVSRWETGETLPNYETLNLLSQTFHVSINTLLGSPQKLICQCCGMPLEDTILSREPDGTFNESYCKWCYRDGEFAYSSLETLIDFLSAHMATKEWPEQQVRAYLEQTLPNLSHWRPKIK